MKCEIENHLLHGKRSVSLHVVHKQCFVLCAHLRRFSSTLSATDFSQSSASEILSGTDMNEGYSVTWISINLSASVPFSAY